MIERKFGIGRKALFGAAIVIAVAAPFVLPRLTSTPPPPVNPQTNLPGQQPPPALPGMPEATELTRAEGQYVAERVAEFCQNPSSVEQAKFTPAISESLMKVPVFIYHRVTDKDPASHEVIHPDAFREQMKFLKDQGYNTITVTELTKYMHSKGGGLPPKTVVLTFDDGWKDNVEAAKVLAEYDFSATFYIISGFFENTAYVDKDDVIALAKNPKFEIGSHTHSHFVKWEKKLGSLDLCTMAGEMVASKRILQRLTKRPVLSIAWPYGYNTKEAVYVASQLGYESTMMVSIDAHNGPGNSSLFIRRLNVDGTCPIEEFQNMLKTRVLKECM